MKFFYNLQLWFSALGFCIQTKTNFTPAMALLTEEEKDID